MVEYALDSRPRVQDRIDWTDMPEISTDGVTFRYRQLGTGRQPNAAVESFLVGLEDGETLVLQMVVAVHDAGARRRKKLYYAVASAHEVPQLLAGAERDCDGDIILMAVKDWDKIIEEARRRRNPE